jgi:hypothetical protein
VVRITTNSAQIEAAGERYLTFSVSLNEQVHLSVGRVYLLGRLRRVVEEAILYPIKDRGAHDFKAQPLGIGVADCV